LRLTRLRLNGFKSFVDPTEMPIHDGLTGIVGPNGCGKSNLLEALRWVMGENRASAMRGGGMEDVIFAGAASRPPRAFAEVAVSIDNRDRLAPQGFNDADQIEIARRITREGGSAFRANGREVRARDVQMLFADASTGAHSPALVRQGQIAELIAARPRARRRILEEAAGISGLYARRHEAELKLQATEANLARIDDVLDALAQQIVALTRQARAAARYREIGDELRRAERLLLYRRFREADEAAAAAETALRERLRDAAQAAAAARQAAAAREAAEAALPPRREEAAIAAALRQRLQVERDRLEDEARRVAEGIAALQARIAQCEADAARETQLAADAAATLARLDGEAATLAAAADGEADRLAMLAAASRAAAAALAAAETGFDALAEDAARLAARRQAAERLVAETAAAAARAEAEAAAAGAAEAAAGAAAAEAAAARVAAEAEAARLADLQAGTEAALRDTETARAAAQAAESGARAARASAEGELQAVGAEVAALRRLLARPDGAGIPLIDRIAVTPGHEAALGAALADDLRAPEADGERRSGWTALAPYASVPPLPAGAVPLAPQVQGPPLLARRLALTGVVEAAAGDALQAELAPGQRLVSLAGDLWRWDGFRAAAADTPQAAAERLRQTNRLQALTRELAALAAGADAARADHAACAARLQDLTAAEESARAARRSAEARLLEAARRASRAEAEAALADGRREAAALARRRHADALAAARDRLDAARAAAADLPDLAAARAAADRARGEVEAARTAMLAARGAEDEARRAAAERARRGETVARELAEWRARGASAERRAAELAGRRAAAEADLATARRTPDEIAARRAALGEALDAAAARLRAAGDALAAGEAALRAAAAAEREAERAAAETREARARAEAVAEAAHAARAAAAHAIREASELSPDGLLSALRTDPGTVPPAAALEADVARLRRQREALGAVNLRAETDLAEVGAEHDRLAVEKTDLEEAIRRLRGGIAALNREGRERLATAFEQVNANFGSLFSTLFGGGEARLTLVESDDPLEAGLEILAQPPGKKLSVLSLLSGGEQTLTALALIFAVFLANPAPICVLDEVDAPLDDANVGRFCDLLDEMTRRTATRFLIITHHAVTMARMDRLFGVTMAEQGVSQLVSVDLRRAEALVA
jgi:chromosome segregation protein